MINLEQLEAEQTDAQRRVIDLTFNENDWTLIVMACQFAAKGSEPPEIKNRYAHIINTILPFLANRPETAKLVRAGWPWLEG